MPASTESSGVQLLSYNVFRDFVQINKQVDLAWTRRLHRW